MREISPTVLAVIGSRKKVTETATIPNAADQYKSTSGEQAAPANKAFIKNGAAVNEPLMEPVLALVAPDATPSALRPLSPSLLPDTAAAKEPPAPTPEPPDVTPDTSDAAINALLGITTESLKIRDDAPAPEAPKTPAKPVVSEAAVKAASSLNRGTGMPEHVVVGTSLGKYDKWLRR